MHVRMVRMIFGLFHIISHEKAANQAQRRKQAKNDPKRNSYHARSFAVCFIVRTFFAAYRAFHRPILTRKHTEFLFFTKGAHFMPYMSQKRKKELSLFLNDAGRVEYNVLCRRCVHECKQPHKAMVVECRRYLSKRSVEVMENG